MATITINEISQNYTFSTNTSNFCAVALPITACWGPAFEDPESLGKTIDQELESCAFSQYPATAEGLEAFVSTFRGPASTYRSAKDYSYHIALNLLAAGYDIDVCRVCPGSHATGRLDATIGTGESPRTGSVTLRAKYPGSFGNKLIGSIGKVINRDYWNLIVYTVDASGAKLAVENLVFHFDFDKSTETVLHVSEIQSAFFDIITDGIDTDTDVTFTTDTVQLSGGADRKPDGTPEEMMTEAINLAVTRYNNVPASDITDYKAALISVKDNNPSVSKAATIRYMEWCYNAAYYTLEMLTDKLAYNSKRLIMPGWDDQNIWFLTGNTVHRLSAISPLHARMMEVAAEGRCIAALLDLPKSLERSGVWNDSEDESKIGYTQIVSRYTSTRVPDTDGLFSTHSALFGPWAQFKYAGTSRNNIAPPAFLALLIQIAMVQNQSLQYEWIQPESRTHNLSIGQPDYKVPKKLLDAWQSIEGCSLNVVTELPDLGMTVWGNSTCFEVPPATYNALQNLSTRYLMNAIKDVVFRAGVAITFQYNNDEAYTQFYVAVTPLLDSMRASGAITKYTVQMAKDINGLDSVNLNSVIGKICIWVEGIINNITVDLVALPSGVAES